MANEEHLKILSQGVGVWNEWRKENPDVQPELSGANLVSMDLTGANLRRAYLPWVKLDGANLGNADLNKAYLLGLVKI